MVIKILKSMFNFAKNSIELVINLYVYVFKVTVWISEIILDLFFGEEYLELFQEKLNKSYYFYTYWWEVYKKKFKDKIENLILEYIWKIKRSNHPIIRKLAEYLSQFSWFNNNIINF